MVAALLARLRGAASARSERAEVAARLQALGERLAKASGAERARWREAGARIDALKARLSAAIGAPVACRSCERRTTGEGAAPFEGGLCCGGETAVVFRDEELVSLGLRGFRIGEAKITRQQLGCAFRELRGCTLRPQDRAGVCLHYTCSELRAELGAQGRAREVAELGEALRAEITSLARAVSTFD